MSTKRKTRGRGRPKGSGKGLTALVKTMVTPSLSETIDASARSVHLDRASFVRQILERWEARKLRRTRRRLLSVLQARIGDTLSPPLTLEKIERMGESKHGEGPVLHPFPSWPGPKAE